MVETAPSQHKQAIDGYFNGIGATDFSDGVQKLFGLAQIKDASGNTPAYHPDLGAKAVEAVNGMKDGNQILAMRAYAEGKGYSAVGGLVNYTHEELKVEINKTLNPLGMNDSHVPGLLNAIDHAPELVQNLNGYHAEQKAAYQKSKEAPVAAPTAPKVKEEFATVQDPETAPAIKGVEHVLGLEQTGIHNENLAAKIKERTTQVQAQLGIANPDGQYTRELHNQITDHLGHHPNEEGAGELRRFHTAMNQMIQGKASKYLPGDKKPEATPVAQAEVQDGMNFSEEAPEVTAAAEQGAEVQNTMQVLMLVKAFEFLDNYIPNLKEMMMGWMDEAQSMLAKDGKSLASVMNSMDKDSSLAVLGQAVTKYITSEEEPAPEASQEQVAAQEPAAPENGAPLPEEQQNTAQLFRENTQDVAGTEPEGGKPRPDQTSKISAPGLGAAA